MIKVLIDNKGVISSNYVDVYIDVDNVIPTISYDDIVEQKIRQKYTVSAEFAVLRQRDEKTTEYAEYYAYCEQCKAEAKAELGLL